MQRHTISKTLDKGNETTISRQTSLNSHVS